MHDNLLEEITFHLTTEEVTTLMALRDSTPQFALTRRRVYELVSEMLAGNVRLSENKCWEILTRLEMAHLVAREARQRVDLWYMTHFGRNALALLGEA